MKKARPGRTLTSYVVVSRLGVRSSLFRYDDGRAQVSVTHVKRRQHYKPLRLHKIKRILRELECV